MKALDRNDDNLREKTQREVRLKDASAAAREALCKLEFLGLRSGAIEYDSQLGGYCSNLPMGLGFIVEDIERQLEFVNQYFEQQIREEGGRENICSACDLPF